MSKTALLIVDVQKGFDQNEHWGGNRNNPDAEQKIVALLTHWRQKKQPVFHILHSSLLLDSPLHITHPGFEMKDAVKPQEGEHIIVKNVNSAFIGTDLKEQIDTQGIKKLVIVGLTTNHCISTTTRMAGNYGYDVTVISDATATFDRVGLKGQNFDAETIHQTALASINDEFATVMDCAAYFSKMA